MSDALRNQPADSTPTIIDPTGRSCWLPGVPQRIVSLVPSLTEYLFTIGVGDRVVGITDFCTEPAERVVNLPRLRGTKNPDKQAIIDLQPDLVIAAKEENLARDVKVLEAAGIAVYVTDIRTVAGALEQLSLLANLLDAGYAAAPLLHALRNAIARANLALNQEKPRPNLLAFTWRDPWMAAGDETYINDLLRLCGAENVALRIPGRYPRASLESFLALYPDVILLPDEPYHFGEDDWASFAAYQHIPAVAREQIYLCDGKLLTWYGPRTLEALQLFGTLLGG